jgi:hypothetical protein
MRPWSRRRREEEKRPPRGGLKEPRADRQSRRGERLRVRFRSKMARKAETGKAAEHHRPGRKLGNCRDRTVEVHRVELIVGVVTRWIDENPGVIGVTCGVKWNRYVRVDAEARGLARSTVYPGIVAGNVGTKPGNRIGVASHQCERGDWYRKSFGPRVPEVPEASVVDAKSGPAATPPSPAKMPTS